MYINKIGVGEVSPSAESTHTYDTGTEVTLTATPDGDYVFSHWAGSMVDTESTKTTITMIEDKIATVTFLQKFDLTLEKIGSGTVSPETGTYIDGDAVAITAQASPNWIFFQWIGDVAATNTSESTITMNEDKTATAEFLEYKYSLNLDNITTQSTWGTVGKSGYTPNGKYYYGQDVTITATPETGYDFDFWSGDVPEQQNSTNPEAIKDGKPLQVGNANNPLVIIMNSDKTIYANYKKEKRSLTMGQTGQGEVSPSTNSIDNPHVYDYGDVVTLTATPSNGWRFDRWIGDVSATDTLVTTISLQENETATAVFIQQFVLDTNQIGLGEVEPSIGLTHTYDTGTEVTLVSTPSMGWQFFQWLGDVSATNTSETTITMNSDKEATAVFLEEFDLTVDKIGNGTVNPESGTYLDGEEVTLTAQASPNWIFSQWLGDVAATNTSESTIKMNSDKTATALFLEYKYTLSLEKETGQSTWGSVGKAPITSNGKYYLGQEVTIIATPNEGYLFKYWEFSGGATISSNPYNLIMNENKVLPLYLKRFSC